MHGVSILLNFLGFIFSIVGLIIPNATGFSTATNTNFTFNYVLISIGVLCTVAGLSFVVTVQCLIKGNICQDNNVSNRDQNRITGVNLS